MTPDTVLWIASMTKPVTGAAVMQLVEQGKLHLDRAADHILPELADIRVLDGFDQAGEPVLRAPKRDITLRHLLTHTAGFGRSIWNADLARYHEAKTIPPLLTGKHAALASPLTFDPGERWDYSTGLDWAGKMVEAVSGQKLGVYFKEHLFRPLGMDDTGFKITDGMRKRLAKVHRRSNEGSLTVTDFEIPQDPEFELGGGGLYSTIDDYAKFMRMILNEGKSDEGEPVLEPETLALMSANQMGDCRFQPMKTMDPKASNDFDIFPGMPKTWGFSFLINTEQAPTGRSAGSLAWAGLANSYFWIDQTRGIAGVLATQILPFADPAALGLSLDFEKAVYDTLS